MRMFIYKTLFVFLCVYVTYEFTIGNKIRQFEKQIDTIYSKESLQKFKEKIRNEMRSAIKKDVYLTPEDAKLISKFFEKVQSEINPQK